MAGADRAPVLSSEWKQSSKDLSLTLYQSNPIYILRLPILLEYRNGAHEVRWVDFSSGMGTYQFPVLKEITSVKVDPDWTVFHSTPEIEAGAFAEKDKTLAMFKRARGK